MDKKIEINELSYWCDCSLEEGASWYEYYATDGSRTIHSYIIVPYELRNDEKAICNLIQEFIVRRGFDNFIDIEKTSPYLQELIINCHQSENDMWFVEDDEWDELSTDVQEALDDEIDKLDLTPYVEFGFDPAVTIFGGIPQVINFLDPRKENSR